MGALELYGDEHRLMRVAHVTLHGCIRAHKQAWCLSEQGHEVHFLCTQIASTHSGASYCTVLNWNGVNPEGRWDSRQLANSVKLVSPFVDVFHVHNEPNWIFRVVKEHTDKPIIFDIHDWTSLRNDPSQAEDVQEEEFALLNADGFIVPSKGYLLKLRRQTTKPSMLLYSMVGKEFFAKNTRRDQPGVVFEGGIRGKNKLSMQYDYRNWSEFAHRVANQFQNGHKVYFYTANADENLEDYTHEKVEVFSPHIYPDLIEKMSHHSVGLVGAPVTLPDFMDSMPNKLFEYVAAGLPCVVINSPEAQTFVEENELGIGIQDASEVPKALEQLKGHNVLRDRWRFTMESQIPQLLAFYGEICGPKRMIPQL